MNKIIPTESQLNWQNQDFGMFFHFGVNTFNNKEWSAGNLDPKSFNPKKLNTDDWVETVVAAGAKYVILTAKHHDGFCLWQTETTDYCVKSSPWRDGKGDVVKDLSKSCKKYNMNFGIYLSPWDRHESCYPNEKLYDDFYIKQLTELLTNYGKIFEVWLDGAGSENRKYDWNRIMDTIKKYHNDAMIFNMGDPTIRWVGNENGLANETVHYVVKELKGSAFSKKKLETNTQFYCPPECDVAIRQNWFWQTDDLHTLKTKEHLLAIYYRSIGRGCNLLLNVPPDRDGLISKEDKNRLLEFTNEIKRRFSNPIDLNFKQEENEINISFNKKETIDHIVLNEDLSNGQKIFNFEIQYFYNDKFFPLLKGTTIGHKRILPFKTINTDKIKIILKDDNSIIKNINCYKTDFETLPNLGKKLNYDDWSNKADPK